MAWYRVCLGVLLVGAVAVAGIALNFTLLRLTQDAHDPVGRLSPRAVFSGHETTPTVPAETTTDGAQKPSHREKKDGDSDD